MANTYYKYAEREADSYINWAEIGKNMSDMLTNENKIREEKKKALDESSRQFGLTLSEAPQGESKQMNEWALKYAGDAQQARLMQDNLLKSGKLKLNDYLVQRQNLTDGTKMAFDLTKEYQSEFKNKWDRMKANQSQDLEQFLMAEAEGFGNFNQTQLYINPTDGKVSVAYKEKGEDGVYRMSQNPNNFTDINSLRNRIKGQFDRYDVDANMESFVKGLGTEISSIQTAKSTFNSTGTISEVLDITNRKNLPKDLQGIVQSFEDAETKALKAQLADPYNASSILTNALDICPENKKPYTYTWDKDDADANPEKILLRNKSNGNPVPVFSEKQENDALLYLRTNARLRYDRKEEIKTTPQIQFQERRAPTAVEYAMGEKNEAAKNFAQNLVNSLIGGQSQQEAGTKYLGAKSGLPIQKTDSGYTITNAKGETQVFPFVANGQVADAFGLARAIIGPLNTMGLDEDMVMNYVKKLMPNGDFVSTPSQNISAFEQKPIELTPFELYGKSISNLTGTISSDEEKVYDGLNASLSAIGASVRIPFTSGDYIVVKAPNGAESKEIDLTNPKKAKIDIDNFLKANPKGKTTLEQEKWIGGLSQTGVIGAGIDTSTY